MVDLLGGTGPSWWRCGDRVRKVSAVQEIPDPGGEAILSSLDLSLFGQTLITGDNTRPTHWTPFIVVERPGSKEVDVYPIS